MKRRIEAVWRYRDERLHTARESKKPGFADTFLSCGGKRSKQAKGKTADTMANAPLSLRPMEDKPTSPEVDRDVAALSDRCALIMRNVLDAGSVNFNCNGSHNSYCQSVIAPTSFHLRVWSSSKLFNGTSAHPEIAQKQANDPWIGRPKHASDTANYCYMLFKFLFLLDATVFLSWSKNSKKIMPVY